MADKEERIVIIQWNIKHNICPAPTEYQCGTSKSCDDCKVGMSRQEAIERMAKALEEKAEQMARECLNSDPCNNPLGAEDLAEAALNALLEDK